MINKILIDKSSKKLILGNHMLNLTSPFQERINIYPNSQPITNQMKTQKKYEKNNFYEKKKHKMQVESKP